MKVKIYGLDKTEVGSMDLEARIFGLTVRQDIVKRVIDWQGAKKMAGTHSSKTVSEVSGTTKKPFKQKGTGNARQGSLRSAQMRGGGVSHGPVVRDHSHSLPKKIRKLGLCHALSSKFASGKVVIIDSLQFEHIKTKSIMSNLDNFNFKSCLIIGMNETDLNLKLGIRNIHNINFLPEIGANVYDIVRHEMVIFSKDSINKLQARLGNVLS